MGRKLVCQGGRVNAHEKQLFFGLTETLPVPFNNPTGGPIMNTNRSFFHSLLTCLVTALALSATLISSGCDDNHAAQSEQTAQVMLTLPEIPEDVTCIRVTAAGEFRSSVNDFDVVPGTTLTEALTGLPVGSVVFSANAYNTTCDSVTKSTNPLWISDEKTVNLVLGRSSSVTLTLYKNGRAKVTVDFADQEDGGTDARTSSADGGASD
jgi:hypothetical protein